MASYQLPTVEGRALLVRPCVEAARPLLQIGILSRRGNIMEAVTIEAADVLGLARGTGRMAREAQRRFARAERLQRLRNEESYAAALARNPWLNNGGSDAAAVPCET